MRATKIFHFLLIFSFINVYTMSLDKISEERLRRSLFAYLIKNLSTTRKNNDIINNPSGHHQFSQNGNPYYSLTPPQILYSLNMNNTISSKYRLTDRKHKTLVELPALKGKAKASDVNFDGPIKGMILFSFNDSSQLNNVNSQFGLFTHTPSLLAQLLHYISNFMPQYLRLKSSRHLFHSKVSFNFLSMIKNHNMITAFALSPDREIILSRIDTNLTEKNDCLEFYKILCPSETLLRKIINFF